MMIVFVVALIVVTAAKGQVNPDIVYTYTDAYKLIWKDSGSEAHMEGAVWRAQNYQSEYCSLGDVGTGNHGSPSVKAVLVSQNKAGALINPSSFSLVWKDRGSGAYSDVAFYKMNSPSGYTCLGGVAVNSHSTKPDSTRYCCVRNEYVVPADTVQTWNDQGSGTHSDFSLWTIIRAGGDAQGLYSGTFVGVSGYSRPSASASVLLKADGKKVRDVWSLPTGEDKPLNLYEVGDLKMIWNDAGSGASADCSIWRSESKTESKKGYYPLGDIVVASHSKPKIGFLLRVTEANDDSVQSPVSYSKIWNDRGSGADRDVQLWEVHCPGGYVALGNVATSGSYPKLGDVYCVKSSYTSYGSSNNWKYVWRDYGSGARSDVSIFEGVENSSNLQSVRGFGAVASYTPLRKYPYFLNTQFVTYWKEKPVEKIFMFNLKYNLNAEKKVTSPVKMSATTVENFSDQIASVSRTITFSIAESSSFTFIQAIELGISMEIEAGLPLVGVGLTTTISASTTSTLETGDTTTKTHTDSIQANVVLPKKSKITAVIIGTEYKADIPYTATVKKIYYDGTQGFASISGIYKGVAVSEFKVTFSEIEYFK